MKIEFVFSIDIHTADDATASRIHEDICYAADAAGRTHGAKVTVHLLDTLEIATESNQP